MVIKIKFLVADKENGTGLTGLIVKAYEKDLLCARMREVKR